MLTEKSLHGIIVPVITPFDEQGNLDRQSFAELIERLASKGIHGLVINGITGEAPAIRTDELKTMLLTARTAIGNIPLIVGIHATSPAAAARRISWAKLLGADAALVAAPASSRSSQQGIIRYFETLAEAELPIIVLDRPYRAGVPLELATIQAILALDHVIGLKESTGNIQRVFKLSRFSSKPILCGEDELLFASLSCGAKGGILASANLDSEQFVEVYESFRSGKIEQAHQRFEHLLPLIQFLITEPNPAPLKWLLAERGHIRSDHLRLPAAAVNSETAQKRAYLLQSAMG
ncbi:dihydrodipicolinate synthase family protein [Paenibacillus sp. NPDC057934]|uniref:dihydrodipicolinate synthase family protein n=1 Tax=Paenibacillus sp. NPDC057934 TaxID=3346282 RepID=UPI0036D9F08B